MPCGGLVEGAATSGPVSGGFAFSRRLAGAWLWLAVLLFSAVPARAARIGDLGEIDLWEQTLRFFSFQDPSVRMAMAGALLLGLTCGLLGGFIVVRRLSLMGDTLSHAVLPGVVLGFLWGMTKDPLAIFIGATLAGVAGTLNVSFITATTRLKEDTALGMVLAGYFAIGAVLMTMVQRLPAGNQSGIHHYLFGQAAAIGPDDLVLMSVITVLVLLLLLIGYKELLVTSFDSGFARLLGVPAGLIHHLLMLLLAFAVVVSLQAVGVVLVSAMLIIPAAAAYLLAERMPPLLLLAAVIGMVSGAVGVFLSFLGNNLPTGPFMVLASGGLFFGAFFFSPRHGVCVKLWRRLARSRRVERENTLKAVYHIFENKRFTIPSLSLRQLAEHRKETLEEARRKAFVLRRHGLLVLSDEGRQLHLTPDGWRRAAAIVRNHRLWELYLTRAADIPPDHVHDDAENIEHVLGEETVLKLEKRLGHAGVDPHGKAIPSSIDIARGNLPAPPPGGETGGGRNHG